MKRLKSKHISILTLIVFAAALLIGMQSDWWILEGRKTPLDGVTRDSAETSHDSEEEDHATAEVTGSTTVQSALDLGITIEEIELVLQGEIDDYDAVIKDIVEQRGLKFGEVKSRLNSLID